MIEPHTTADDLRFIRRAVDRSASPGVAGIYFLWGAILGVGIAVADLRPDLTPWYWVAMGPTGFAAAALLGVRAARSAGQDDRADGMRHLVHWAVLLAMIAVGTIGVARGLLSGAAFSQYALLMAAGAYLTAGIHLERRMLTLGGILLGVCVLQQFGIAHAGLIGGGVFAAVAIGLGASLQRRTRGAVAE